MKDAYVFKRHKVAKRYESYILTALLRGKMRLFYLGFKTPRRSCIPLAIN